MAVAMFGENGLAFFGQEHHPVLVIDDFFENPASLIDDASMLSFKPIGLHYPGVRAVVAQPIVRQFVGRVSELISETFGIASPFQDVECSYSLVTTPPADLAPIQRLPHFDSADPYRIAILHYLSPAQQGGTSFFRHRGTGFESVNAERQAQYVAAVDADIAQHGVPDAAYISGDTALFEQIAHFESRFNRAIIYRGNTLHCADIPACMALSANPAQGRLTINTFINGQPLA